MSNHDFRTNMHDKISPQTLSTLEDVIRTGRNTFDDEFWAIGKIHDTFIRKDLKLIHSLVEPFIQYGLPTGFPTAKRFTRVTDLRTYEVADGRRRFQKSREETLRLYLARRSKQN